MLGWPTTDWIDDPAGLEPVESDWIELNEPALHTFTHFHLVLRVQTTWLPQDATPSRGHFVPRDAFDPKALPTVMQKAYTLAAVTLRPV